uniref:Uncharacterized protein n=1 Tax=Cutavirus TaxID=1867125 RepID=A0A1B0VBY9_9VIRU|nr:hypothetical protein [Cutavirus]
MQTTENLLKALPCLLGFIIMTILFCFFLTSFLSSYFNCNNFTNLTKQQKTLKHKQKQTLIMGFLPTLLSLALALLIWALFIWMFYFNYNYKLTAIHIQITNTNVTYTIQPI